MKKNFQCLILVLHYEMELICIYIFFKKRCVCITAGRMSSTQVCRPHFHTPIHPWLTAESSKGLTAHSNPWVPFSGDPDKSQSPSQPNQPPHNLFSFPPTPPKDSTPDSVVPTSNPGSSEYQSAVAHAMGVAFMQQQQHDSQQSCSMDVKPAANLQNGVKQREGSDYENATQSMFNSYNADGPYAAGSYAHGLHNGAYGQAGKHSLTGQSAQSPNKPRNKSRTSAGKIFVFCSFQFFCFPWLI